MFLDQSLEANNETPKSHDGHEGPADGRKYPNKWPKRPEMACFRPFAEAFYEQCNAICLTLVKALEVDFGVADGSLVERCIPNATDLRLAHYPPIPIAAHSDFGILTLLFQDSTGGLEVEDRFSPGTFVPVPPTDTKEMIVNVGDTLQRWTNAQRTVSVGPLRKFITVDNRRNIPT
ncbi:hypothetical protein DL770_008991 [Monosporascus sp. CRB-9-2]|nr:hypothetical protein DL770_008991 [Monosporascus sp. CRB-9-2]